MRRCYDVAIINHWFLERVPPGLPVKVRVSYQKLLKNYVLNELHKRRSSATIRRSLLRALRSTKFFRITFLD